MPWCPVCRQEFVDGVSRCDDCGAALVDKLPEEKSGDTDYVYANPVFLMTASSDIEGDNIGAVLDSAGIPVTRRHDGIAGYWKVAMGSTPIGVHLYVPESMLTRARELLLATGYLTEEGVPALYGDDEEARDRLAVRRRQKARWLLAVFLVPALLGALAWLVSGIFYLFGG